MKPDLTKHPPGNPDPDEDTLKYRFGSGMGWYTFIEWLERGYRFFDDPRAIREIVDAAAMNVSHFASGTTLYRARAHEPHPAGPLPAPIPASDMWAPPFTRAVGNRLNPPGIRYLYLTERPETAMAELRPAKGTYATVARFTTLVDLALFDFTADNPRGPLKGFLARMIGKQFRSPAHPENAYGYVASQFIAETLKFSSKGQVHGIRYRSALDEEGVNIALFGGLEHDFEKLVQCEPATETWHVSAVKVTSAPGRLPNA